MGNKNGKFKIRIESDGENVITECRGKFLHVCAAISTLLIEITEGVPAPSRKLIIETICKSALDNIEAEKDEEDVSIEDIISEIFKN